ncbi:kinase-like domain-containing protein [Scenedesmus sp. NREL 46B-D3]|nr:kinase-like domain-containing protein [Scenedesmus sp. NREL 46B-D3]
MQAPKDSSVTFEQLYVSTNQSTKVFLDAPNVNAPIKIALDATGVDYFYVHCGSDALAWRARLEQQHECDAGQQQQSIEHLARHVAVHVLLALQELQKRGLVHRDVKPSNILLASPDGPTWLSDMGLAAAACRLPGFVKGLDLAYVPPEYIVQQQQGPGNSSSSSGSRVTGGPAGGASAAGGAAGGWCILDDLPALAERTATAADMYQLGLSIYQLLHGSLPPQLVPARGVAGNPRRLSSLLQRVATFAWQTEIDGGIANRDAAEFLRALLCRDPALRPDPQSALQRFAWLQPVVNPALQLMERQVQAWPQQRQEASLAAKWMELMELQQELGHKAIEELQQQRGQWHN